MTRRLWAAETCVEEGCGRAPLARSLCSPHYQRRKRRGEELPPKVRKPLDGVLCDVEGCEKRAVSRGLCPGHVARSRRYGFSAAELADVDAVGSCEACGGPAQHVDHEHSTGLVRGILCRPCNTALGLLGDDPERLSALIRYLDRFEHSRP